MFFKNKTTNYLFINRNEVRIVIQDTKFQILFNQNCKAVFFNDTLTIIDVKTFKYALIKLIQEAEKILQTTIIDFVLVVDGIKVESRSVEITREFVKHKKISKYDILKIEEKAKELIFDSDISIFAVRPSEMVFDSNDPQYSIPFDSSFKSFTMSLMMLGFEKTTFNNLVNIINDCKINILMSTTSQILSAMDYIVNTDDDNEDLKGIFISVEKSFSSILIVKENCFCYFNTIPIGFNDLISEISNKFDIKQSDVINILSKTFTIYKNTLYNSKSLMSRDDLETSQDETLDHQTIYQIQEIIKKHYLYIIEALIQKYSESIKNINNDSLQTASKLFFDVFVCGTYNSYLKSLDLVKLNNATISVKNYIFDCYIAENSDDITKIQNENKVLSRNFLHIIFQDCQENITLKVQKLISKFFN